MTVSQKIRMGWMRRPVLRSGALAGLVAAGMLCGVGLTGVAQATPGGRWLHLFHIGHDESPNVVQYDLVVDDQCRPLGASPVKVYWRFPKKGNKTRPLKRLERRAYAVEGLVTERDGVRFHLAGRPEQSAHARALLSKKGKCKAEAWTEVSGRQAKLDKAWINTGERNWLGIPSVLFVDVFARGASGERVFERLRP